MEAPHVRVLLGRVQNESTKALISGLSRRGGILRLVRRLGFTQPLLRLHPGAGMPPVRLLACTRRATMTLFVVALRRAAEPASVRAVARALRASDGVRHHLLIVAEPGNRRVTLAVTAPGVHPRQLTFDAGQTCESDVDALSEILAAAAEADSAAAHRIGRALDRSRVGARFFRDVTATRDAIARSWTGLPPGADQDRNALALLLLSRLIFLYFLQRQRVLDDDGRFLPRLLREWLRQRRAVSFHRGQLRTLFFGVLNRRPADRTARARALGELPYLNGGLFERQAVELRWPDHDLRDDIVARVFRDLLERYRFTSNDAAETAGADVGGVAPEMLGRIFEGLMPGERRGRTGTFYTPASFVDDVVARALALHFATHARLDAGRAQALLRHGHASLPYAPLSDVPLSDAPLSDAPLSYAPLSDAERADVLRVARTLRVLDPACGSGAFLMATLARLTDLCAALDPAASATAIRRDVIGTTLHGVDLLEDAALICSLRLWLTLIPQHESGATVSPLPNLDRRIRQGDALVDPLDITGLFAGRPLDITAPPELRALTRALAPAARQYLLAGPEDKPQLRQTLARIERELAGSWLSAVRARLAWDCRELAARAGDTDLFGTSAPHAAAAQRGLRSVTQRQAELDTFMAELNGSAPLPFFSFRVHFAEAGDGFDVILGNPPWIRSHAWPPTVRSLLRARYAVCRNAGWPRAARLTGTPAAAGAQVDLSLLFLEQSCRLLSRRGTLALLLPAKVVRSLYAGGGRELMHGSLRIRELDDHSLHHRGVFDADAFTAVVIAQRAAAGENGAGGQGSAPDPHDVRVTLHRSGATPLRFSTPQHELPLVPGDLRAPWLLAPPAVTAVLRAMQRSAPCIGDLCGIHRGVMTGANNILVLRDVEPKLGDLAKVRAEGYYRASSARTQGAYTAWVEGSAIRPLLRGTDIAAWRATVRRHVLWTPGNGVAGMPSPTRLTRYLKRHRARLGGDDATRGTLQRLSPHTLGHKVVWSDLAADLRAAAVPATVRGVMGHDVPVVPLNTVYFIATRSLEESMLLAAYMNSLPLRVLARAIAERAKDAHFRFFAWTIAVLPLPADWRDNGQAAPLAALARAAHARGHCTAEQRRELDTLVARSYGLEDRDIEPLRVFDAWLSGVPQGTA
jgi:hypothetical protein